MASVAVVGLQFASALPSSVVSSTKEVIWHHYDKKTPTKTEVGIKEYWANCSDQNHQFLAPISGTIIDMGTNYDTSEFTVDDDRWLTYCDEYGHTLDEYHVCSICEQLDGDLISAKALNNATKTTSIEPLKGFKDVYQITGVTRGNKIGINIDISTYNYVYFGLRQDFISYLNVYGGDNRYAYIDNGIWTYFLLVRNQSSGTFDLYQRTTINDEWITRYMDTADKQTTSLSNIRFYNWNQENNYSIYCTEVYASTSGGPGHDHTPDISSGICTSCLQLPDSLSVNSTVFATSEATSEVAAPKGFTSVQKGLMHHNSRTYSADIDISLYSKLYFAVYANINTRYFSGAGKAFWTKRWNYIYMEKVSNTWIAYGRDPDENEFTQLTMDYATGNNWNQIFKVCATESSNQGIDFYMYCTEVVGLLGHTYDSHGVCTTCMQHRDGHKASNYAVAGSIKSADLLAPTGFKNVYAATGKSNGSVGVDLDITDYTYIYFALYGTGYLYPFSGGQDNNSTIWSGRWFYIIVEKAGEKWNAYVKDGVNGSWNSRVVDGNTDTNFSSLLRLYNWDGLQNVTIYNTEVYCSEETIIPVDKTKALNIGVWNGSYHFSNTSSIDDLVNAGINVVIGVNPIWNPNWENVLNYALSRGVKFIVDPRGWDSDNGRYADWDGTCPSYASHDAVLGFIMWDEPSAKKYSAIAELKQRFEAVMPEDKLFFINLLSSAASLSMLFETESVSSSYSYYETNYANAYQNTVQPDLYSYDSYPLFDNGKIRKSYFATFDIWSNLSRTYEVPTWYTFLSSSHDSGDGVGYHYVLPSEEQLKWQMSIALSFGITNIMHYIYATGASDYSCMANVDGSTNEYFNTVVDADSDMHMLDTEIVNYAWEGAATYHNNSKVNLLFKELQHTYTTAQIGIQSVSATSDLIIGSYADEYSNHAYMVVNSGISTDYSSTWSNNYRYYNANVAYVNEENNVQLTIGTAFKGAYVIQNGVKSFVSATNGRIDLSLCAYGSAFVIPTK